jgi:hypothetical protein
MTAQSSADQVSFVQDGDCSVKTEEKTSIEDGCMVKTIKKTTTRPVNNTDQEATKSSRKFLDDHGCMVKTETKIRRKDGLETTIEETKRQCKNQQGDEYIGKKQKKMGHHGHGDSHKHSSDLEKQTVFYVDPEKIGAFFTNQENRINKINNAVRNNIAESFKNMERNFSQMRQQFNRPFFGENFPWF